jgi:hypothetical protein
MLIFIHIVNKFLLRQPTNGIILAIIPAATLTSEQETENLPQIALAELERV